ncbi:MAG: OmpH family outer membrane protein [Bryobacteraceae bacterium]
MKKNVFAIVCMALGVAGIAAAQAPTKIAVIQIQGALVATKEGQKAAADLETRMGPRKRELEAKQAEIKDLQDRLQKGGNTLSDSAKDDLTRNIDQKTKSYNRQIEDAQAELEGEQQKVLNMLGQKMMQVIDKYAQQNGYAVVLDVSNQNTPVLYASNTVDITKDIVEMYDKSAPTAAAAPAAVPAKPAAAPAAAAPKPAAPKPAAAKP